MTDRQPVDELAYEQAFDELEAIVQTLEAGDQNLEESLALFERGQALAERCSQLLASAELKLHELIPDGDGVVEQPAGSEGD